jgi:uncharacterized protein YacL
MTSADFLSRIIGMFVFALAGARLGLDAADPLALPSDVTTTVFGLVGALFGLIITPWITTRPLNYVNVSVREMPVGVLFITLLGGFIGLVLALLMAYPMSQLPRPFDQIVPPVLTLTGLYLGVTVFRMRAREIAQMLADRFGGRFGRMVAAQSGRQLLLDTSVLIDGRIVEIAKTGFLGGTLLIPRFVMSELHQVADSSDPLRRNRGRRGLLKVNDLTRNNIIPVKIIDDDVESELEVDNKLVALAIQLDAYLVTNDFPLSKVAEGQGVSVLNINLLANAVRVPYLPGEVFPLRIIQEGSDPGQGVGYLDDGTMVVVNNGRNYMDRTIEVEVTKFINRETGRMIFAVPVDDR